MISFILLNFFYVLTAFGYVVFASQAFDRRRYRWFPFPQVATDHWSITLLKVVPTCLCLIIATTCFDYGWHWFTLAYAGYLALMPVGDWVIFRDNDRGILIFALAHVLSETTVLAFLLSVGVSGVAGGAFVISAILAVLFVRAVLKTGKLTGSMRIVVGAYALMLVISMGSYTGLAVGAVDFPLLLRISLFATPFAIVGVDALYTVNEYIRPVSQLWILGFYYLAIWLLAVNMILLSRWVLFLA